MKAKKKTVTPVSKLVFGDIEIFYMARFGTESQIHVSGYSDRTVLFFPMEGNGCRFCLTPEAMSNLGKAVQAMLRLPPRKQIQSTEEDNRLVSFEYHSALFCEVALRDIKSGGILITVARVLVTSDEMRDLADVMIEAANHSERLAKELGGVR